VVLRIAYNAEDGDVENEKRSCDSENVENNEQWTEQNYEIERQNKRLNRHFARLTHTHALGNILLWRITRDARTRYRHSSSFIQRTTSHDTDSVPCGPSALSYFHNFVFVFCCSVTTTVVGGRWLIPCSLQRVVRVYARTIMIRCPLRAAFLDWSRACMNCGALDRPGK